jgi:hypothetical protein
MNGRDLAEFVITILTKLAQTMFYLMYGSVGVRNTSDPAWAPAHLTDALE